MQMHKLPSIFFNHAKNFTINGGDFSSTVIDKTRDGSNIWKDHISPGAFHNSRERLEHDPPKCHPHTCVAVIKALIDWINDGQKTTFIKWLNGPAGAGKSAIAQEIADLCHESGCLAASFFWSRNTAGRNTEERLIATLAYQLSIVFPSMGPIIEEAVSVDQYIVMLVSGPSSECVYEGEVNSVNFV